MLQALDVFPSRTTKIRKWPCEGHYHVFLNPRATPCKFSHSDCGVNLGHSSALGHQHSSQSPLDTGAAVLTARLAAP